MYLWLYFTRHSISKCFSKVYHLPGIRLMTGIKKWKKKKNARSLFPRNFRLGVDQNQSTWERALKFSLHLWLHPRSSSSSWRFAALLKVCGNPGTKKEMRANASSLPHRCTLCFATQQWNLLNYHLNKKFFSVYVVISDIFQDPEI